MPSRLAPCCLLCLALLLGCGAQAQADGPPADQGGAALLAQAQEGIYQALVALDQRVARAAADLGPVGLDGPRARQILRDLGRPGQVVVNACLVDPQGRILAVEPASYGPALVGQDISGQEQVQKLKASGQPVLSRLMPMLEGFEAADLEYPVFSPQGQALGSVSLLLRPSLLLEQVIRPLTRGTPYEIWAMETNGRILYDSDYDEVGLSLFEDAVYQAYPTLLALGRRMAQEESGQGAYTYLDQTGGQAVIKDCLWTSVDLHGTWWRLALTRLRPGSQTQAPLRRGSAEQERDELVQAMETLGQDPALAQVLAKQDWAAGRRLLAARFQGRRGFYCVQVCDAQGRVRMGYPAALSLEGHDFSQDDSAPAQRFYELIRKGQPASVEMPLLDGRQGLFIMRPVRQGGSYRGMIYILRIRS